VLTPAGPAVPAGSGGSSGQLFLRPSAGPSACRRRRAGSATGSGCGCRASSAGRHRASPPASLAGRGARWGVDLGRRSRFERLWWLDLGEDGFERVEPRRQRKAFDIEGALEEADEGGELVVGEVESWRGSGWLAGRSGAAPWRMAPIFDPDRPRRFPPYPLTRSRSRGPGGVTASSGSVTGGRGNAANRQELTLVCDKPWGRSARFRDRVARAPIRVWCRVERSAVERPRRRVIRPGANSQLFGRNYQADVPDNALPFRHENREEESGHV